MQEIAVLNRSSVATDDQVHTIVDAAQQDLNQNFAPGWRLIAPKLTFVPHTDLSSWKDKPNLVVLDTSDEATALGYHDLTPDGLPLGKAFAKTDALYGALLSVTLTHELWEMIVDPDIQLVVEDDQRRGIFVAYESADAVEDDRYAHTVNGVKISNFQLPSFFSRKGKGPYDFGHVLSKPFQLAHGGYESYWTANGGWKQRTMREDASVLAADRPKVGSRRERRRTPNDQLQLSAA
jgi:hypothetical protein